MPNETKAIAATLERLYPGQTPAELAEIERNLQRYLHLVWQIHKTKVGKAIDRKEAAR